MPEFHAEPYLYLPAVTHKSALIAWGAFYFRVNSKGRAKLVDDDDLKYVHPPRKDSIGAKSAPYGPARVDVYGPNGTVVSSAKTAVSNHCWVAGLAPDMEYTYRVFVNDEEWGKGERWDWSARTSGLVQTGAQYENRFRTFPDPLVPAASLTFAAIGDFGVGVKRERPNRCQQAVADALRLAFETEDVRFILTTGDNIYATKRLFGVPFGHTGSEDDDWFFTYFQPYRYVINRIPVFPSIGNHDTDETEGCDDRGQVEDNFYVCERVAGEEASGRASFGPGLFYKFRFGSQIELVCLDTSKEAFFRDQRLFEYPKHWEWVDATFAADVARAPAWQVPFAHHPPYSAGPHHHDTASMHRLIPLFQRAGVRVMLCGHEHNFQHSHRDGIDYFITGAAGKLRGGVPDRFEEAGTRSWSASCHFLLVRIDGDRMQVRPIAELREGQRTLSDIQRLDRFGAPDTTPIEILRRS